MRIAFVTNVVYPFVTGGAQKRVHEIGKRLAADGHDVTVYGRHFWDGPRETTHDGMTLRAVAPATDLYVEEDRRSITEAIDFAARLVPELRSHIDEHDVIVASVFPYFPVLSARLTAIGTDTPVVTTWHEVWRDYWDEYLGRLAVGGKAIERLTASVAQHPVAVSNATADRLAALGPSRDRIEVVPNGIDVDQIANAPEPAAADRTDVLFAGRLIAEKRVDVLLRAFDRVADKHDATIGIIGDGPESERLRTQAAELDAADRVTFFGFLDDYEDVLGHMQAAEVFASPSTREGFGITYLEAMAAGCVVVGADHAESAASEVIGDAGYVVEPTVGAVADVLDRVLDGERPPTDPLEHARQYDWDAIADDAADVYRRASQ